MRGGDSGQQGSVLVLAAAMSLLLIGFVGLAVDGGEIQAQQRQSQNAADGAALAAATAVINADNYAYTTTDATNIAIAVAGFAGIDAADVTVTYKDGAGSVTSVPTSVATVTAAVAHNFQTLFLPVMGIDSASISATATVSITQASTGCAVCALSATASPAVSANDGGRITVSGGALNVLSSGSPAILVSGGGGISATAVTSVGSTTGGPISPAATTGPLQVFVDPLITLPVPTLGAVGNDVVYAATQTINPGTYGKITVVSGVTVTMNPGQYIITGGMDIGGTLRGNSVFMYFSCADGTRHSIQCATPTDPGDISISGTLTVSAPPSGSDYTGLVWFGDRNNTATITIGGSAAPTGTLYAPSMKLYIPIGAHQSLTSRVIVGTINVDHGGRLDVTYTASGNYVAPGKLRMTA